MKKTILTAIVMLSIMALCCESDSILNQIIWTTSWVAILAVSGKSLSTILEKEETND